VQRADVEAAPPFAVARADHGQVARRQGGPARGQRAGQQAAGQAQQQADLGVRGLAVLGGVQRHGVLVAVHKDQAGAGQCGHDAEQAGAVTAEDEREPAGRHRVADPIADLTGHHDQGVLVEEHPALGRR
jgi:hypothetical protein